MGLFFSSDSKKTKIENDDSYSDLSFDFDDEFNDFDTGSNREPIDRFKGGIKRGISSAMTNPSTYKKLVLDSLPEEYGTISTKVSSQYDKLSRVYTNAVRSLEPEAAIIADKVDKLIPEDQGTLRKVYDSTLGRFKSRKREDDDSEIDAVQQQINDNLAEIFKAQNVSSKRSEARDSITTGLAVKTSIDTIGLLGNIEANTYALRSYQDTITQAYQKKSLELQYRSYFVQAELLKKFIDYSSVSQDIGKSVIKNTSLPDFVKATDSEKIGDVFKSRFGDKIYNRLFGNDYIAGITKSFTSKIEEITDGIKSGVSAATMVNDLVDDKVSFAGEEAGSLGVSGIGSIISSSIKGYIDRSPRAKEFLEGRGKKLKNVLISNTDAYVEQLLDDKLGFDINDGSIKGYLKEFASDILRGGLSGSGSAIEVAKSSSDIYKPSVFTDKAHTSITEIIPGYLGKILREISILRTGDTSTPLVMFDYRNQKFTDSRVLATKELLSLKDRFTEGHVGTLDRFTTKIVPKDTPEDITKEISMFIDAISRKRMVYSPAKIRATDEYNNLSEQAKTIVSDYLGSIEGIDTKEAIFESNIASIRNRMTDPRGTFEESIRLGQGSVLESLGLLVKDKNDLYKVDRDKYHDFITGKDTSVAEKAIAPNAPIGNIGVLKQSFNNQTAGTVSLSDQTIASIVTPIVDVVAAGTKDLSNLSVVASIDDKHMDRVDTGFTSVTTRLDTIIDKIGKISFARSGRGGTGTGRDYTGALGDLYRLFVSLNVPSSVTETFMSAIESGSMTAEEVKTYIEKTYGRTRDSFGDFTIKELLGKISSTIGSGASSIYDFITKDRGIGKAVKGTAGAVFGTIGDIASRAKDPLYNALNSVFGTIVEFSKNAFEIGKDLLMNKLPTGLRSGFAIMKSVSEKFNNFYLSNDVYVKGETDPRLLARLLRNGYYKLRDTGESIYNYKDIKGTIVDPDGNVVLSTEDINKGLVDKEGEAITTPFEKLISATGSFINNGIGRIKNLASSISNGIFGDGNFGFSFYNDKVVDVLIEIRNLLMVRFGIDIPKDNGTTDTGVQDVLNDPPSSPGGAGAAAILNSIRSTATGSSLSNKFGTVKDIASGLYDRVRTGAADATAETSRLGKLKAGIAGFFKSRDTEEDGTESTESTEQSNTSKIKDLLSGLVDRTIETASTARGKVSQTYNDRLARIDAENAEKHKFKETEVNSRYDGKEGILGTLTSMFGFIKNFFTVGGFSGFLGSVLSKIPSIGGILASVGELLGSGLGGVLGSLPAINRAGSSILGAGARLLKGAAGLAVRGAGAIGGVMFSGLAAAAGTAGSAIVGGLGTALAGAAAVLTSPVALSALAIGATAYGAYKLYSYFKGRSLNDYENIRYLQYGIDPEDSTHKNRLANIRSMEQYVIEKGLVIGRDTVSLVPSLNVKELYEAAGLDPDVANNKDNLERFNKWFVERFKPVFLKHSMAIVRSNPKFKLDDVEKLSNSEKLTYLSMIADDSLSSTTNHTEPPYSDMNVLVDRTNMVKVAIEKLIVTLRTTGAVADRKKIEDLRKSIDLKRQEETRITRENSDIAKRDESIYSDRQAAVRDTSSPVSDRLVTNPIVDRAPPSNKFPIASNSNVSISEGDGTSSETSVKLEGSGNVPISKELRVAGGPLRDGRLASKYITLAKSSVKLNGIDPNLLSKMTGMIEEYGDLTGKKVIITDGFRTYQEQAALKAKYPNKAAPPGRSLHEFGLAVDIDRRNLNEMESLGLMRKYGFTRPVGGEPWHMEPAGIQGNIARAKEDRAFREQAIDASLYKGGGGYGTMPSSKLGRRNDNIARSIIGANASKVDPTELMSDIKETTTSKVSSTSATNATGTVDTNTNSAIATAMDDSSVSGNDNLSSVKTDPSIVSAIDTASKKVGIETNKMLTLAAVESDFNPNAKAKTSTATGLFQVLKDTFADTAPKVGVSPDADRTDPYTNSLVAAKYTKDNDIMLSKNGIGTGIAESYLTHFLGPTGARKLLSANDTDIAAKVLPSAANSNKAIFYNNGTPRTVAEVKEDIRKRLVSKATSYGIPLDSSLKASGSTGIATASAKISAVNSTIEGSTEPSFNVPKPMEEVVPPRATFKADDIMAPTTVEKTNATVNTNSDNYNKIIAGTLDVSVTLQQGMLSKLSNIDANIMKALTNIVEAAKGRGNNNRYNESLKPTVDLTRTKTT